jgi:2-polyprenyl-3-methyl-5-hydroxy-6-metoxy-1,4-benzoquinol methylase
VLSDELDFTSGRDPMSMERKDFDREAASWDEKPERVRLANDIADAIRSEITLTLDMNVLDFGCGTGLVTLRLQPFVASITGADSSQGMLNILSAKIAQQNLANVRTLYLDPDRSESLAGPYHLIVSSMTFHHVKDIHSLVALYYRSIAPEGYLAIADLDSEGGMFHGSNEGVFHPGFERDELRRVFTEAGFREVRDRTAAEIVKPDCTGAIRRFSVFLMTGRKIDRHP